MCLNYLLINVIIFSEIAFHLFHRSVKMPAQSSEPSSLPPLFILYLKYIECVVCLNHNKLNAALPGPLTFQSEADKTGGLQDVPQRDIPLWNRRWMCCV